MKFILICATGRSGSTTLQRIINSIEGANIRGENWGAVNDLLNCYKNIKKTNKCRIKKYVEGETKIKPAWYNCFDYEVVRESIKNTIMSIIYDKSESYSGFKEIRYMNCIHLIDEFIELFPDTKVICHISDDLDRQCKSGWYEGPSTKPGLQKQNNELIQYTKNKNNCFLSYMKNLFDISEVRKLFEFLDEELDEKKYQSIINSNLKD